MSSRRDSLKDIKFESTFHAGLWLDKYIVDQDNLDKTRRKLVDEVSAISSTEAYGAFYKRWEKMLEAVGAKARRATTTGRIVIGLGDESVLETSVTLHHTYGVPYIPGSALKGLAANYARQRLGETWQKNSEAYQIIFGNTEDAGYINFFDALYVPGASNNGQPLHPDVITVHHPKYYQGNKDLKPPADWDSPTPIPFLSATGTYLIALAAPELDESQQWIECTFEILGHALKTMGIGAKTTSGYGRMEFPSEPDQSALQLELNDPDLQKVENYLSEIATIPDKNVSRQIQSYFGKLGSLKSDRARIIVARAIIERVRQANIEQTLLGVGWYKAILTLASKK